MARVYIGVGSNLGDRALTCERAIDEISGFSDVTAVSSFYETEPVGYEEQPLYINCAVEIMTDLTPHELLDKLWSVENKLGRVRWGQRRALHSDAGEDKIRGQRRALHSDAGEDKIRGQRRALHSDAGAGIKSENRGEHLTAMPEYKKWGPRTIDLDIIFYGDEIIEDADLKIPHPEAHKRRFVLEPLYEIAPEYIHPVHKVSVTELLKDIQDSHKVIKLNLQSTIHPQ